MSSDNLRELLAEHMATPFPTSVEKGLDYGSADAVMIGADIYGLASQVESGKMIRSDVRSMLGACERELSESLDEFPEEARPYYAHLLRIARAALARG